MRRGREFLAWHCDSVSREDAKSFGGTGVYSEPREGTASVEFGPDLSYGRITSSLPVNGHYQRANILVAGMRASTTYHMLPSVNCPNGTLTSQDLTFQTGALPSIPLPQMTVTRPNPSTSSPENPGIELIHIVAPGENKLQAYFTDRDANPIWYYDVGRRRLPLRREVASQWARDLDD